MNESTLQITEKQKKNLGWIKWYLSCILSQEMQRSTINQTIEKLKRKHDSIDATPRKIKAFPHYCTLSEKPESPKLSAYVSVFFSVYEALEKCLPQLFLFLVCAYPAGIILILFAGFIDAVFGNDTLLLWLEAIAFPLWKIPLYISGLILVLFVGYHVIHDVVSGTKEFIEKRRSFDYEAEVFKAVKYNEERATLYKEAVKKEKERVAELGVYKEALMKDIKKMEASARVCEQMIQKLYATDVIHPKYRKFDAVYKIYELLSAGRCYELTGPFGAYNLYEHEMREDQKLQYLSYLPTIASQLEAIRNDQLFLSKHLMGIESSMDDIYRESVNHNRMHKADLENSRLIAMHTKQLADNSEIVKNLTIWEKRMKGDIPANTIAERWL